jgi:hypothetical protein
MPKLIISDIQVRQDAEGRYSLNDLHRAAIAQGANERTKEPAKFLNSPQTIELIAELTDTQNLGIGPINAIKGGSNQGTYVVKELVYAYAMWISAAFSLKVIRAYDALTAQAPAAPAPEPEISATLQAALCREAYQLASDGYDGILAELKIGRAHV